MGNGEVVIPWALLGSMRDDFQIRLNGWLDENRPGESSVYLEITCYFRSTETDAPDFETNVTSGRPGARLPDLDLEEGEDFPADEEELPPIIQYLAYLNTQLNEELTAQGINPDNQFVTGVRALILSPNPGIWCAGWRCEWNVAENAWRWCYYYPNRTETKCLKRWGGPCTPAI